MNQERHLGPAWCLRCRKTNCYPDTGLCPSCEASDKAIARPAWAKHDAGGVSAFAEDSEPFPGPHELEGSGMFIGNVRYWSNVVCERCSHPPCPCCVTWCDVLVTPDDG